MIKPVKTWILVADSAKARIFENLGRGRGIAPLEGQAFSNALKPSRDLDADQPGRTFDSAGQGRHAMEKPTNSHRLLKKQFARELARHLRSELEEQSYDRLIIVAPPVTLGDIRAELDKEVASKVLAEIDKDLTKLNPDELAEHLAGVIAV
jgi:protein required for attachment to host cells